MTATVALTDDTYSANGADGRKRLYVAITLANPYTATGEVITTSSYFPNKPDGGKITMISAATAIDLAGIGSTGTFRGSNASTTALILQFFNNALPGAATIGRFVDNTVANLTGLTVYAELIGR